MEDKKIDRLKIIDKLKKIAELADRGIGGERSNAKAILQRLLDKYKLTLDDLMAESTGKKSRYCFTFRDKRERSVLFQCFCKVVNTSNIVYYQVRWNKIAFELTPIQSLELNHMYRHFKILWRKEIKALEAAFIIKHDLHSNNDDHKSGVKLSDEEVRGIYAMMMNLDESNYVSTRKMIEGE